MKLRRMILGGIVAAGVLVLALGIAGVFTPGREHDAERAMTNAGSGDGTTKLEAHAVIKGSRATGTRPSGDNWVLTAPEGRGNPRAQEGMKLSHPALEIWRKTEHGERRAKITADTGIYTEEKKKQVEMFGNVRVEYVDREEVDGAQAPDSAARRQQATLLTDSLAIDIDAATGRTDADVELIATTQEGRHVLRGTGAEFVLKHRVATVLKNIQAEGTGGTSLFEALTQEAKKPETPPKTKVTCRGPCVAHGLKRTVVLQNDVVATQGEDELRADKIVLHVAEKQRMYERITASGNVSFKAKSAGVAGSCERLSHIAADDLLIVEGSPVTLQQGTSKIRARKLEMDPKAGCLFVPMEGQLTLTPPPREKGKKATPLVVAWADSMRFDRPRHNAVFRGDIRFTHVGQTIECQVLSVKFDEDLRELVQVRAQQGVRVSGRIEDLMPPKEEKPGKTGPFSAEAEEMTYDPKQELLVLSENATLKYSGQFIQAQRIEIQGAEARARAVEGVRVSGRIEDLMPAKEGRPKQTGPFAAQAEEMIYEPEKELLVLSGNARLDYSKQRVQGGRIEIHAAEPRLLVERNASVSGQIEDLMPAKEGRPKQTGPFAARCDRMTLRPADQSALFTGRAELDYAGQIMRGEHIEIEGAEQRVRVKGAGSLLAQGGAEEKEKVTLNVAWSGDMDFIRSSGRARFRRDVSVAYGDRKLRADTLTARIGKDNSLAGIEAEGNTVLEEPHGIARGDMLVWDMETDRGRLTGSPAELTRGNQKLLGDTMEFSEKLGRVRITSRHRVEGYLTAGRDVKGIVPAGGLFLSPTPKTP